MREYETTQLGVFQVTFGDKGGSPMVSIPIKEHFTRAKSIVAMLPYARWFLVEIYRLGPEQLLALCTAKFLASLVPAAKLYTSNWLFRSVRGRKLYTADF